MSVGELLRLGPSFICSECVSAIVLASHAAISALAAAGATCSRDQPCHAYSCTCLTKFAAGIASFSSSLALTQQCLS